MAFDAHPLSEDFSEIALNLQSLSGVSQHTLELVSRYRALNKTIHRIEAGVEKASELRLNELKKRREKVEAEVDEIL